MRTDLFRHPIVIRLALVPVLWIALTFAMFAILHPHEPRLYGDFPPGFDLDEAAAPYRLGSGALLSDYGTWLGHFVMGDWGASPRSSEANMTLIRERLLVTGAVALPIAIVATALSLGIQWCYRRNRQSRAAVIAVAAIAMALPLFAAAFALIIFSFDWFDYALPLLVSSDDITDPDVFARAVLPLSIVGGVALAPLAWLRSDRNLPDRHSLTRQALVAFLFLLPFAVVVSAMFEPIFSYLGLGELVLNAVRLEELRLVQASLALFALGSLMCWALAPRMPDEPRALAAPRLPIWPLAIGAVLLLAVVMGALVGPVVNMHDAETVRFGGAEGVSLEHPFGTDRLGRDLQARIFEGARTSLQLGAAVVLIGYLPAAIVSMTLANRGLRSIVPAREAVTIALFAAVPILVAVAAAHDDGIRASAIALIVIAAIIGGAASQLVAVRHGTHGWRSPILYLASVAFVVMGAVVLVESSLAFYQLAGSWQSVSWGSEFAGQASSLFESNTGWIPAIAIWFTAGGFFLCAFALREMAAADDAIPEAAPSPSSEELGVGDRSQSGPNPPPELRPSR